MGRGVVEAMYASLPVVASRVGGLSEVVEDGQTDRLVTAGEPGPLAEAILLCLENEPQRREHGKQAWPRK
jgi:glycosyltransferase involved in cell wall biosynthesis